MSNNCPNCNEEIEEAEIEGRGLSFFKYHECECASVWVHEVARKVYHPDGTVEELGKDVNVAEELVQ